MRAAQILCLGCTLLAGCGDERGGPPPWLAPPAPKQAATKKPTSSVPLPRGEPRLCTAVAILVDASKSMRQTVRDAKGRERPKRDIAREALERIVDLTDRWRKEHPDQSLELAIYRFSSEVEALSPMAPFDAAAAKSALDRLEPASGTAIGRALEEGYKAVSAAGCLRKHIVCITDGENTSGPSPDQTARAYHEAAGGEVSLHFVAFDISARKFGFLRDIGGDVGEAADGSQLEQKLTEIYEKKIFVEAMPDGK